MAYLWWQFESNREPKQWQVFDNLDVLLKSLQRGLKAHDHVVVMSNGAFGGIHSKIIVQPLAV